MTNNQAWVHILRAVRNTIDDMGRQMDTCPDGGEVEWEQAMDTLEEALVIIIRERKEYTRDKKAKR